MKNYRNMLLAHDMTFRNLTNPNMAFEQVFEYILRFMRGNPRGEYSLILGTDSQVHSRHTTFITGIAIKREGNGAWACYRKVVEPRKITSLHDKISLETTRTEEVAYLFTPERKNQMIDIVLPHIYEGATFSLKGHLDIGDKARNKTREYINEMVSRIESLGLEPVIKPDAFIASGYANRYTK